MTITLDLYALARQRVLAAKHHRVWIFCTVIVGSLWAGASLAETLDVAAFAATSAATTKYVSVQGKNQAGCGSLNNPCATLQYAQDASVSGGQILIRDPGSYGAVKVTKAIAIRNGSRGIALISAASGKEAITVNTGESASVTLEGLTVEGYGAGLRGITWNSGKSITIRDCDVRGFTDSGILLQSAYDGAAVVQGGLLPTMVPTGLSLRCPSPRSMLLLQGRVPSTTALPASWLLG